MPKTDNRVTNTLSEKDQLDLLKDSIDIRFANAESNEFAPISQFDPKQLKIYTPDSIFSPAARLALVEDLEESAMTQKSVRQLCGITMLVSLFASYLLATEPLVSYSGIKLLSALSAIVTGILPADPGDMLMVVFPAVLSVYGALLTLWPNRYNHYQKYLRLGWHVVAWSGILHFFTAIFFHGPTGAVAGFGYYLGMTAVFAYYYLAQFSGSFDQKVIYPLSSTAKL